MSNYLGIDTSNYTTSVAVYDDKSDKIYMSKRLLPVKSGEKGLRQSDAVFHHTVQLPEMMNNLYSDFCGTLSAVGASVRPRDVEGSYMPCFLVGKANAVTVSKTNNISLYEFSHQQGHIVAALYSANKLDLIEKNFIAFHLSGGTTEAVLVSPDKDRIIKTKLIAETLDLNAGQVVDRVGVMLGLNFPCGVEIEKLALESNREFKIKPVLKDVNCCLSGVENKCKKMLDDGEKPCDIALYCLEYIKSTLDKMTETLLQKYGNLPLVYAGGVMSDSIIKEYMKSKYDCCFADPIYSSDNAAGVAILTYFKENNK